MRIDDIVSRFTEHKGRVLPRTPDGRESAVATGHLMDPLWPLTFALMYIASTEERRREASAADDEPVLEANRGGGPEP